MTEFHPTGDVTTEAEFVQSIRDGKGTRLAQADVDILGDCKIHGCTILYVYDPDTGQRVGQQWTLNVDRT
jgi:hypothetical protein